MRRYKGRKAAAGTVSARRARADMEDEAIIDLYFARAERAITETRDKYGRLLISLAYGILRSMEDAEECENDTYFKAWNEIPPTRPNVFSAFLAKITRNLSLDRYDKMHAEKRGGGEMPLLLDELAECVPDRESVTDELEGKELTGIINDFIGKMKPDARIIFMRRYWFGDTVQEIAEKCGFGTSKVKMSLARSRRALKEVLERRGYDL